MEQAKRTLNLIVGSFAIGAVVLVVILAAVEFGDPASPDLADGATLTAGLFGAAGLLVSLVWLSRSGERSRTPNQLLSGFVIRVAIAELGLMMGILGLVMTGSMTASYVGLGFFLASLLLLGVGLRRIA